MKRLPISLTIRKMRMNTTMRYHLVPIRMATINKNKTSKSENKFWQRYGEIGSLYIVGRNVKQCSLQENSIAVPLKEIKVELPYDPGISILEHIPKRI